MKSGTEDKRRILITCAKGIAPFLKEEVTKLGFPVLSETVAGIETEGTLSDTMRLNLLIRTGHRVLLLLDHFRAETPDELYAGALAIPWEDFLHETGYLSVTSSVDTPSITDSRFANVRLKDAIVDRIRNKTGVRPDSGAERDKAVISLYWKGTACSLYLDTSGEPLAKRGYRKIPGKAPMQESLAAAVILATGWDGETPFVNPMCGSGTLAIEAALIALHKPSGLLRSNYGFMHVKGFEEVSWEEIRREARARMKKRMSGTITATDISPAAVAAARQNAKTAGVDHLIDFAVCDYSLTPMPEGGGTVILNPEYGERMGKIRDLEITYKGIGDFLKQKCKGYTGYIFTGNLDLAKKVGLRAKRRIPFFNGPIECRLLEYDLYEGTTREHGDLTPS